MSKVLISIPEDLLARIDREARRQGATRSAFLQEAARDRLGWPSAEVIDAAIARGRAAVERAGAFESADAIRRERLARDAADRRRR